MKKHLRATFPNNSLIGQLIAKSGWHGSGSIGIVATRTYEPGYQAWYEVSDILSACIGVRVKPRCSAIHDVITEDRLTTIAPHPALDWIAAQAGGRWLIIHEWGQYETAATARVWFEDLSDVTLFRTAGFGT